VLSSNPTLPKVNAGDRSFGDEFRSGRPPQIQFPCQRTSPPDRYTSIDLGYSSNWIATMLLWHEDRLEIVIQAIRARSRSSSMHRSQTRPTPAARPPASALLRFPAIARDAFGAPSPHTIRTAIRTLHIDVRGERHCCAAPPSVWSAHSICRDRVAPELMASSPTGRCWLDSRTIFKVGWHLSKTPALASTI
jgi:hypothetical protein